ncbi:Methyltransferase-like protein 23 [Linnemannia gamsii]|uniref:Methyltransferase-like protein 23 n=1 Tax=Linnemannia gamsii TaxID=64522 RepID=A0ABQ7K6F3_9FUNG|nr:Methyltransferase-like protein 23 [Linnemannia gamsii]
MDSFSSSASSSSSNHHRQACKKYHYVSNQRDVTVRVLELLDADFGLYVWPSALVLAEYIFHRLDLFTGTTDDPKIILELGAGTALPSLLLAKATTPGSTVLITTDRPNAPHILDNIQRAYQENHISWSMGLHQPQGHRIMVQPLGWGDFTLTSPLNPDGGLLQLLKDVSRIDQSKEGIRNPGKIDLILGSDTFYNPPDFEPLLATVSFIINRHNPECVFLTTYQNRSSKRNIDHLLEKWNLEARVIEWEAFDFDMCKFVSGGNMAKGAGGDMSAEEDEDESLMSISEDASEEQEQDDEVHVSEAEDEDEEDRWLRLAKEEIGHAMSTSEGVSTKKPSFLGLVEYSSGSDSEEEDEDDGANEESIVETVSEDEGGQDYSHKMGDGGSLSSVHFLWICKRGRGDDAFAAWAKKNEF